MQASLYLTDAPTWLLGHHRGYSSLVNQLQICRAECHDEMSQLMNRLLPSVPIIRQYLLEHKQNGLTRQMLSMLNNPFALEAWLNYTCYHGTFVKPSSKQGKGFATVLRRCGLRGTASMLTALLHHVV
jgi:hypothetical protein